MTFSNFQNPTIRSLHLIVDLLSSSSTVRNKESNKRFIGLRWSTINRLLESVFDERYFLPKKDSIRKVIGKKLQIFSEEF